MSLVQRLWNDEAGFVVSAELVLVATIAVLGLIAGLTTVRDQVIQELGDVALAVSQVNQSYSFSGITGHHSSTAGTSFDDATDDCDGPDIPTIAPACISLAIDATTGE